MNIKTIPPLIINLDDFNSQLLKFLESESFIQHKAQFRQFSARHIKKKTILFTTRTEQTYVAQSSSISRSSLAPFSRSAFSRARNRPSSVISPTSTNRLFCTFDLGIIQEVCYYFRPNSYALI